MPAPLADFVGLKSQPKTCIVLGRGALNDVPMGRSSLPGVLLEVHLATLPQETLPAEHETLGEDVPPFCFLEKGTLFW